MPTLAHAQIAVGSRVVVTIDAAVRPTPGGALLGTQLAGSGGVVTGGPSSGTWGFTWWNINFDSGVDGWVTADRVQAAVIYPGAVVAIATRRDVAVWNLKWTWDANVGTPSQTLAEIERGPSAAGPWTALTTTVAGATSYDDFAVVKGLPYCYRIRGRIGTTVTAYALSTPCPTP